MKTSIHARLKSIRSSAAFAAVFLTLVKAHSTNWQLVWDDEFNGSIGPDWTFQNGGGGWGNNELEYYQPQNASIQNNTLVITAEQQSVGGENYTSARLTTQGHQAWLYGKIVARIAVPAFEGSWPAFWMLGSNIGSVGWPQCGELDIMEQINTANTVNGSTHWYSGGQADFTGSTSVAVTGFHEYSVEWNSQYITWLVDGTQYNQFYIGGNAGGTAAFNQNSFFVTLNLAVGGNWPGFSINNGGLPAAMYVDYVRVYQASSGNPIAGTHEIMNAATSLVIDNGSSTAQNAKMLQWGANGGSQQKWTFTQNSDTSWNIVNQYSGQALDDPGYSTANGTQMIQWGVNGGTNQRWWVDQQNDGSYKIWNVSSSQSLDNDSDSANGSPLVQWAWNGGTNQRWLLK